MSFYPPYFVQYAGGGSPTGTMTATATPTPTPTPSVTGISPTAGPTVGGTSVTITGTSVYRGDFGILWRHRGNLVYGKQRYFDHRDQPCPIPPEPLTLPSLQRKVTSATSGSRPLHLCSTPGRHRNLTDIRSWTFGGTSVTITWTGFTGTTSVSFGGTATSSYTVNSATSITATSPCRFLPEQFDITVTTPGGHLQLRQPTTTPMQ